MENRDKIVEMLEAGAGTKEIIKLCGVCRREVFCAEWDYYRQVWKERRKKTKENNKKACERTTASGMVFRG